MKGDKENYPVSLTWLMVVILFAVAWINFAKADDFQSNDMNAQTAGNVDASSKSLGLAGGDVDLAQCYRSYNYFIVWQDSKPNPLCLAQQLMAEGNYEAAAVLRCQPWSVSKAFGGKASCIAALSVAPSEPVVMEPVIDDHLDDEEEWHEEQIQMQQDYDERIAILEARANRPATSKVVNKPLLSDKQRAALAEVLAE